MLCVGAKERQLSKSACHWTGKVSTVICKHSALHDCQASRENQGELFFRDRGQFENIRDF